VATPFDDQRRHRLDRLATLLPFLEALPTGALVVDAQGTIVAASGHAERLFGYGPGELDGRGIETLMAEAVRSEHARERARFVASARSRPMAAGRELEGLRKDGTTVPVQIGLSQIELDEGPYVLAVILDLSERRALERRASQAPSSAPGYGARLHPDDRSRVEAGLAVAATELSAWRAQFRLLTADGHEHPLEAEAMPSREADGSLLLHGLVRVRKSE